VEHWCASLVGFLQIKGQVEGPVDEGLVNRQAVFGEVGVAGVAGFGIEADLVAGGARWTRACQLRSETPHMS
jgi:hypothetical protein